jgi:hypothetical protein
MGPTARYLVLACVSLATGAHCQAQTALGLFAPTADPASRLRPANAFLAGVIEEGVCRSQTLRSMVAALQASDVIVYVTMRPLSDRRVWGGLEFIGATATDRVLRVVLRLPLDRIARMAILGHELRHAIEVAGAREIRSQKALEDYYRAHGIPGATEWTYETDAAHRTELRVREEVTTRSVLCGGVQPAGK